MHAVSDCEESASSVRRGREDSGRRQRDEVQPRRAAEPPERDAGDGRGRRRRLDHRRAAVRRRGRRSRRDARTRLRADPHVPAAAGAERRDPVPAQRRLDGRRHRPHLLDDLPHPRLLAALAHLVPDQHDGRRLRRRAPRRARGDDRELRRLPAPARRHGQDPGARPRARPRLRPAHAALRRQLLHGQRHRRACASAACRSPR